MQSTPLLSIVIQSYNYKHYLPDAIDSILVQDFPSDDMELIIIDDASTDGSPQIIQEYANRIPYIKVVQYEENKGTHYSINHSLDLARGEYIHWLAADDFRDKHFLKRSMEALLKNPSIGICCSDFGYAEEKTGRSHLLSYSLLPGTSSPLVLYPDRLLKLFQRTKFWIPGHTTIVKKESVIKYGKFNKNLREKCDWFLFHQIALHEGVIYIPEVLAYIYSHPNSYSAQILRLKEARRAVAKELLSVLDKKEFKQTRKLFYRATLLGWIYREIPLEFLKPKRWKPFLLFVKKRVLRILRTKIYPALNISR